MSIQNILTVNEVAERLRIHPRTAYRLVNNGTIPSIRVGRQIRVSARALDDYLDGQHADDGLAPHLARRPA